MKTSIEDRIREQIQWRVTGDSFRCLVRDTGNSAAIVPECQTVELVTRVVRVYVLGEDVDIPRWRVFDGPTEWHKAEVELVRFDQCDAEHGEPRMRAVYSVGEC